MEGCSEQSHLIAPRFTGSEVALSDLIDRAQPIRSGERLPLNQLSDYLETVLGKAKHPPEIQQFPRGFSNLTYLLRWNARSFVLRRPPFGANIKTAHDMGREFRVLSSLEPVFSKIPKPIHYCEDLDVIGAPFYLMTRVQGVILRDRVPEGLSLGADQMRALSRSCVDQLVELHSIDLHTSGLIDFGKPEGYTDRQVKGWIKRYGRAQTDAIESLDRVIEWLEGHRPSPSPPAFIHNDFKYDNLVLDPGDVSQIIALLDWEMATVGEPLMDLGTALAYWAEPNDPKPLSMGLTHLPGNLNRQEVAGRYAEQRGLSLDNVVFYYVFGLFKLAVIAQQIYARFKLGHTKDPRFGALIHAVRACGQMAVSALEHDRIHQLT